MPDARRGAIAGSHSPPVWQRVAVNNATTRLIPEARRKAGEAHHYLPSLPSADIGYRVASHRLCYGRSFMFDDYQSSGS